MKHFASFGLDTANESLWHEGRQITLPPKPFAVLRYLVENPGRLISHDELLDALWPETYVQPQVLRTYVLELRKVLGDDARQPRFIQSLPKRGYRFLAAVTERAEAKQRAPESTPTSRIVGREQELELLRKELTRAAEGERRVVFVAGDPGIGKTALVEAFCSSLDPALSAMVASGRCVQGLAKNEQFYPVMEALAQLCASADGERTCRLLARMAPVWLAALGREPQAAPRSTEERAPGDLCAALEELAAEKPLILLFEDMHWADESTLNLVSALARRKARAHMLVLCTHTPHAGASEHPLRRLKQDLLVHRLACDLALAPLTKAHMTTLLRGTLGQQELPAGLDRFVLEHSEGNPLFAIAIVEHLIAQRFLICKGTEEAARWEQSAPFQEMEAGVPDELAQMIELEIGSLSEREQHLLEAGSLFNVAFPAWAVAAALNEDPGVVEEACDGLARRLHYVKRAGQDELPDGTSSTFYVFGHGLYREVLYQRQSATRRCRSHAHIAERLAVLFAGREMDVAREMAMHHEAAGNWLRAAQILRAAAQHARLRKADGLAEELIAHFLRISEHLPESCREVEALPAPVGQSALQKDEKIAPGIPQKV